MAEPRLTTAIDNGAIVLPPEGRIAVFRPRAEADLSALPKDRVHVIQGFKPDHDAFAQQGFETAVVPQGDYTAALVCMTRSKSEARALVASASAICDGPVIVDGQKTDGVVSLLRDIRKHADVGEVISKAHGKLFAFTGGDFADWSMDPSGHQIEGGFSTVPGVFSADGIDAGSAALAEALPKKLPKRIADLGAGWGYLSRAILAREGVTEMHLIEAEYAALECARRNITDVRARFHWADAARFITDVRFDAIVTNPPFHASRATDPAIGKAFIAASAVLLKPSGRLWLVANRHLPYEAELDLQFAEFTEIAGNRGFKILAAAMPRRNRR